LVVGPLSFSGRIQAIQLLLPCEIARKECPNASSHPSKGKVCKQFIVVQKFRQKVVKFVEQRESVDVLVGHGATDRAGPFLSIFEFKN